MTILDSNQYKEAERQSWNSVASGKQKWWKTIERGTEIVGRRLVELAEIKPGSRVLDIATGIGEPALTAANQVGNSGHVLATDISSQMLSFAKQRAVSLGLQNVIEFKECDAETIDLPSSAFDAALCRWGLMCLPKQHECPCFVPSLHLWSSPTSHAISALRGILLPLFKLYISCPLSMSNCCDKEDDRTVLRRTRIDFLSQIASSPLYAFKEKDATNLVNSFSRTYPSIHRYLAMVESRLPLGVFLETNHWEYQRISYWCQKKCRHEYKLPSNKPLSAKYENNVLHCRKCHKSK